MKRGCPKRERIRRASRAETLISQGILNILTQNGYPKTVRNRRSSRAGFRAPEGPAGHVSPRFGCCTPPKEFFLLSINLAGGQRKTSEFFLLSTRPGRGEKFHFLSDRNSRILFFYQLGPSTRKNSSSERFFAETPCSS